MRIPFVDLVRSIIKLVAPDRSVLVGIDGGAGAGKTTFAHWLAESIRETTTQVSLILSTTSAALQMSAGKSVR
jgi:thymidylate kinase